MARARYIEIERGFKGAMARSVLPLYNVFAGADLPAAVKAPRGLGDAVRAVYARMGEAEPAVIGYDAATVEVRAADANAAAVGFSGGLDSAYIALRMAADGKEVTLFHVSGLNGQFPDEERKARAFAAASGLRMVECGVRHTGREAHPDNPFKNQLIMALMADWGAANGIASFALGSDWCTHIQECEVGWTLTDSVEVNEAFLAWAEQVMPGYSLTFIPSDVKKAQRLEYVAGKGLLEHVASCISPHRFKRHLAQANAEKYGVELMDGRCGSCFKCCMEWLLLRRIGAAPDNAAFEAHCWDVLANGRNSHRRDLFGADVPIGRREANLMEYGS